VCPRIAQEVVLGRLLQIANGYFFQGAKMKIRRITPSGYLHPIESYKEIDEQFRTTNFIAIIDVVSFEFGRRNIDT
jgi:hypothetical protein